MSQNNLGISVLSALLIGLSGAGIAIYMNMKNQEYIQNPEDIENQEDIGVSLTTNNASLNEEGQDTNVIQDISPVSVKNKKKKEKTRRIKSKNTNTKRRS